jgi:adenine-specific DNA-methyltransferase
LDRQEVLTAVLMPFSYPKSIYTVIDSVRAALSTKNMVLFLINREDGGNRKYILVEMGEYFYTVTLPRVKKVIYSADWKKGKPQNRNTGISHIMKYISLESYEDTLSNIELDDDKHQLAMKLGDEYMIHYMFDYEAKESMLSLDAFNAFFL